ncbi:hypothetical protein N9W79_00340 [bacterium]|nr:hypothetical protein [bacterium]
MRHAFIFLIMTLSWNIPQASRSADFECQIETAFAPEVGSNKIESPHEPSLLTLDKECKLTGSQSYGSDPFKDITLCLYSSTNSRASHLNIFIRTAHGNNRISIPLIAGLTVSNVSESFVDLKDGIVFVKKMSTRNSRETIKLSWNTNNDAVYFNQKDNVSSSSCI